MNGPVTVTCPMCRESYPVPTEVLGVDEDADQVVVRMDRSGLYGHLRECAAKGITSHRMTREEAMARHPAGRAMTKAVERPWRDDVADYTPSKHELAGRIGRFLTLGAFVSKGGSRACTMCGLSGESCLALVGQNTRQPCCGACGDGNTHPAPGENEGSCAQWAEKHGAKS